MGKRKQADRAEAIVRGVVGLIMVLLLVVMVFSVPQFLKEKDPRDITGTMIQMLLGFTLLCGLIAVIGLIVRVKLRKRNEQRRQVEAERRDRTP
jgi:CDP-diglyceride synthetase